MLESSPSRQRRPPCKTKKGMSDEAADAAALTYLLTIGRRQSTETYLRIDLGETSKYATIRKSIHYGYTLTKWTRAG